MCIETSLPSLDTWITPVDRFYTRSHFSEVPDLDASGYHLKVEGAVSSPLSLSYDELRALPSKVVVATLECAGNSRSYVTPPAEGLSFRHGAVGNARWTGVPVSELLSADMLQGTATEVLFEGSDVGEEEEEGETLQVRYARSLPLEVAFHADTILAYEMNGEPLQPAHGYPVRLIVPGWYAMASVKWLTRIEVLEEPFEGFFQERRYVFINEGETERQSWAPVTALRVKSIISRPRHGEVVQPGLYTIRGNAWSGDREITGVEASTSGGRDWEEARGWSGCRRPVRGANGSSPGVCRSPDTTSSWPGPVTQRATRSRPILHGTFVDMPTTASTPSRWRCRHIEVRGVPRCPNTDVRLEGWSHCQTSFR